RGQAAADQGEDAVPERRRGQGRRAAGADGGAGEEGARRAAPLGAQRRAHRQHPEPGGLQQGSRRLPQAADLAPMMKPLFGLVGLLLSASLIATSTGGQSYPTKPLRWIVPTGPGSAVDVFARRIAPKLSESLGQPVIVENRPGANSMIGAREVARSAADGYTLFQGVINNALNDLVTPDPCCILNEKLLAVTRLISTPLVMVVHPSVPANSVKDYVALARSRPNQLTYAFGGTGAITQMVGELLKSTTAIQVREVPYKAIGAELPDLTGG